MLTVLLITLIVITILLLLTDKKQEPEPQQEIDINNFDDRSYHQARRERLINDFKSLPVTAKK